MTGDEERRTETHWRSYIDAFPLTGGTWTESQISAFGKISFPNGKASLRILVPCTAGEKALRVVDGEVGFTEHGCDAGYDEGRESVY